MKKAIVYILGFMILLTGCRGNPSPQNSHQADAGVLPGETGNEARTYMAETWDAGITPDYQPLSNSFVLTEDMLYYVDRSRAGISAESFCQDRRGRSGYCGWKTAALRLLRQ